MDGIEAATLLRERHDVPIVFLTSHSDEATLARATKTHPQGYLLKPFDDHDLRTTIELALNKHVFEKALSRRERWFATTLESIGDAVLATNPEGEITFVNRVAEQVTGITRKDAIGKKIEDVLVLVNDSGEPVQNALTRAMQGGFSAILPSRTSLLDRQGAARRLDDVAAPIVDEHGELLGGVMVFRDITERTQLERQLAMTERLATVGTLAGGMAHEINNPLAAIVANVAFARDELKELRASLAAMRGKGTRDPQSSEERIDEIASALDETLTSADRVRRIVHDLRYLARAETEPGTAIDIPPAIEQALALAAAAIKPHVKITRLFGTTPYVIAHEHQLAQVIANLVTNAAYEVAEAHPAGGGEISLRTRTRSDSQAAIEVTDNGRGMSQTVIDRVFEPFFTTKPVGAGTGLGLSMARGIVVSLGGAIEVESAPQRGTTFRVLLPPATSVGASQTDTATTVGRARVLVVDDEVSLAQATRRVLARDHDVTVSTRAQEALDLIRGGARFDVIFCDVQMPEMDGLAFVASVHGIWPEGAARTVLVTSGALSPRAEQALANYGAVTLGKPAMPETLRKIASDFVRDRDGA
jgi:PAS domain S-box-containing protein